MHYSCTTLRYYALLSRCYALLSRYSGVSQANRYHLGIMVLTRSRWTSWMFLLLLRGFLVQGGEQDFGGRWPKPPLYLFVIARAAMCGFTLHRAIGRGLTGYGPATTIVIENNGLMLLGDLH